MNPPVDRSHVLTEKRHPESMTLDAISIDGCLALMVRDHRRVIEALDRARPALTAFIEALVPRMREGGRLIYLGAGTSGRLGVLDAAECPPTFQSEPGQIVGIIAGGDAALRKSSEGREDEPDGAVSDLDGHAVGPRDTVLGIAAGGTTPYVLGAIRHARGRGAMTGLLTCAPPKEPPAECDHLIVIEAGPEILTGSTRLKAGTATKIALNAITTTLFVQLGKAYENLMVDLRASNEKLRDRAIRILMELCPHLSREQAATAIDAAGGHLKTAIVMQRLGVDADAARKRLDQHGGHLRAALD